MIRSPLSLRLQADPSRSPRDQLREAAGLGVRGVVLDAAGELNPDRLGDSGRRDLRHSLRSIELGLAALNLPTRRPFDTLDDLDERLRRADRAFEMAYELGGKTILLRAGVVPTEPTDPRRAALVEALAGLAARADRRGIRLAVEAGTEPGATLAEFLAGIGSPAIGASLDPGAWLAQGIDPIESTLALGPLVVHAYARDAAGEVSRANPLGSGFAPGVLDWERYLGALEEIGYAGWLTLWPTPGRPVAPQVERVLETIRRF